MGRIRRGRDRGGPYVVELSREPAIVTAQRFAVAGLGSVWDVLDRADEEYPVIVALCLSRERDLEEQARANRR